LLIIQKEYGLRIQRSSILPNIPRVGGMLTVIEILKSTGHLGKLRVVNNSKR